MNTIDSASPLLGLSQRLPPSNLAAEQALLGALLANNLAYERVSEFLLPEHFADAIRGRIYAAIRRRAEAGQLADPVTLKGEFEHSGVLEEVGGTAYLAQLVSAMVGIINAGEYGRAFHDSWLRRQLIFFEVVKRCLTPDGVCLLHSIGRSDGPGFTNPWLAKYIFPGGYSPAVSEVVPAIEKAGLVVTDIEILRLHYAQTLRHWRRRFAANRDAIAGLYDERFCRMFEFYLAGAELSFRVGGTMNMQIQMVRDQHALPLTRDYMLEAERDAARVPARAGSS